MTTWVFEKQAGAAVRRDPNEAQLFKTEQAEEGEYAGTDALVREVLQNSLDASAGTGPVRLRIALHRHDELPNSDRLRHYFSRLRSPLEQREIGFSADEIPNLQTGFLVCEDFGTRGLVGDPLRSRDPVPGSTERQDFFWFWRNIGRSAKTGDDLGRWGLGKTVYRAASQVGCMLGLTVRHDDQRQLLMGQAVLKIHAHDGTEYVPEGYWCGGTDANGLPLPVEHPADLDQFRDEWKLTRQAHEPGLSVVVPYVAAELKGENILQAICVHFFLPILRGELIVDLVAPAMPHIHLSQESIEEWCEWRTWGGPRRTKRHDAPPIGFARRCLASQNDAAPTILLGESRLPELNEAAFDETTLASLRSEFSEEKLVGVKVRLLLPRRTGTGVEGELLVFLQRSPDGKRQDTYYVREGMTITKLNSQAGRRGIHAFVNVDRMRLGTTEKNPLATLLGDAEGPAHEDWDTSEERPDRTWKTWKGRVKFCRRIVDDLVAVLTPQTTKADFDLLADFFSIEKTQSPQSSRRPHENGQGQAKMAAIVPTTRWFRVTDRRGGFRIAANSGETVPADAKLRVSVAYDLPSGNPLKKWCAFDFDFKQPDGIDMKGKNVIAKQIAGNVLSLRVQNDQFSFSAEGFDQYRDLFVKVEELIGSQTIDTDNSEEDDD